MSNTSTEKEILELNAQYLEHHQLIVALQAKLQLGLQDVASSRSDRSFALDFIDDQVTLFRFLKDCDFDENLAYERLLDTLLWRKENKIDQLKWNTIHHNFYNVDHPAFCFFHKQDRFERPVVVVRMRYFPDFGGLGLCDTMPSFATLLMEMARKWTHALTREKEQQGLIDAPVLVSQILVIIDISKSPMIPLEKRFIQELQVVTDQRFPGFFGSIFVMNFGWLYQGLWQMVKLMLSERAKSKINFPKTAEVKEYIPADNLLLELGGTDDYVWTLENDTILKQYGNGWEMPYLPQPVSPTPPMSPKVSPVSPPDANITITRTNRSLSTSSYSSDDFYDARESLLEEEIELELVKRPQQTTWGLPPNGYSSIYGTPGSLTPIGIRSTSSTTQHYHSTDMHIPSFLTSLFGSTMQSESSDLKNGVSGVDLTYRLTNIGLEQHIHSEATVVIGESVNRQTVGLNTRRGPPHFPHLLPSNDPQSAYANAPLKSQLMRSERRLRRFTRHLFRLSFTYHGTLYWVLLYIFLRGPVEHSVKRVLAKMMMSPRNITLTTVGVTALAGGGLGASLSSSFGY